MKFIIKNLFVFLAIVSMSSCDTNTLDIPQQGVIPVSAYKTANDDQVNQFVAGIYSKVHGDAYVASFLKQIACYNSVKYEMARMGGELGEYYQYTDTPDSPTYSTIWSYYYTLAYRCNMIVENLPGNNVASANVKKQAIAEARTIRAIAMMNLVQLFGNPPLADHILTGSEGNTPAASSWSFIEKELGEAAEDLPSKGNLDGQAAIGGRLTKEAAYAFLGKAYLWAKDYTNAAKILHDKVIATNKYALIDDFVKLNSSAADFCPEYLWEFEFSEATGVEISQEGLFDIVMYGIGGGGMGVWMPKEFRQDLCFGVGGYTSSTFGKFMNDHDIMTNGSKSKRYRGTVASYEEMMSDYTYANPAMRGLMYPVSNCEGYFKIKEQTLFSDVTGNIPNFAQHYTKKNLCYMRYAEVLLNYAEAVAMGGAAGSTSGLDALNLVRRRAGLDDAPALDMNNEKYGVKAERQAELFYEGCRFIDLIRWGDAAKVLADCGKNSYMFIGYLDGNNSVVQTPSNWLVLPTQTVGQGFKTGKNELFPIPTVDINNNPNLKQNPGW